jgi:sulfate/thiosulfate transport system ATP-binding protein
MSIVVENISKTFGSYKALDKVSLEVPTGSLLALLGPSGSGKTTLLRIVAGLELPDAGSGAILFEGEDVASQRVGDRHVGFVFQHYALFRHMTVAENIAFPLRVRPRKVRPSNAAIDAKVQELLELIQLGSLRDRYPSQLSGGQRQRVALARALAVEPKVLLLDEPFGALDAKVRQGLRRWLRKLHDDIHVTSVFVTHDQEEALEVADRVVVMNQSRIEQVGTPDEVFHKPANEFVIDFLGNVNLFHGRVDAGHVLIGPATDAAGNATEAKVYARPFDLDIHIERNGHPALPARVVRVQSAGPVVKIELVDPHGQPVNVEMSHERFRAVPVERGREVFVTLRDAKVFCLTNASN